MEDDGCLYTRLLKALYGCVQASALWYALIRCFLEDLNYTISLTDPCVLLRQVGEKIFILLLYIDDILGIVDDKEAKKLKAYLVARFGTVQFEEGGRLWYLGMEVNITDAETSADMSFYIKQLVEDAETKRTLTVYDSPGTKESFVSKEGEQKLQNAGRVYFHSTMVKLLYLAKRSIKKVNCALFHVKVTNIGIKEAGNVSPKKYWKARVLLKWGKWNKS